MIGYATSGDAQTTFRIALMMYSPTYYEECAADCDGSGEITSGDAQAIFLAALEMGDCVDSF
jgi:hypothetical protein